MHVVAVKRVVWVLIFFLLPAQVAAQYSPSRPAKTQWLTPQAISLDGANSWFPDVATDQSGSVHVVWSSGNDAYDTVDYTVSNDGSNWSAPNDVAAVPTNGEATRPIIVAGTDGNLYLSFKADRSLRGAVAYFSRSPVFSAANAKNWTIPQQVSERQIVYYTDFLIDNSGSVHLVFTGTTNDPACLACFHLFYTRYSSADSSWTRARDISLLTAGAAKPKIMLDYDGNLHVIWESGEGGSLGQVRGLTQIFYTRSTDGGETWLVPVALAPNTTSDSGGSQRNATIGIDSQGRLVLVWLATSLDKVYYRYSHDTGMTWTVPEQIASVWGGWSVYNTMLDTYGLATDSAGTLHLVLVGRTSDVAQNLQLLHLSWSDGAWSAPEILASYSGDMPEWPRLAIGNGNQLHLVWFVREAANVWRPESGGYKVWYVRGIAPAPHIESRPPFRPTSSPTLIPKETPHEPLSETVAATVSTSILDPQYKVQSGTPVTIRELMTENDDVLLLAKSLLPVALLVGVTALALRRRRGRARQ